MKAVFVFMLMLKAVDEITGDCLLSLNNDFSPSPVYLQNEEFLLPNTKNGSILVRRATAIQVSCPGKKVLLSNSTTDYDIVEAKCVKNKTFSVGSWRGELRNITCDSSPLYTVEETKKKCYQGQKVVRVGYIISRRFHGLYEACFDRGQLHTLYVKHELKPSSNFIQQATRPPFTGGDFFGNIRMSDFYKVKYQKQRIDAILGDNMNEKYLTKHQYLTRGHLAPRADFPLGSLQRPSFHFVNVAPQWRRSNAGDWAALEEGVRRTVFKKNTTVTVYTGTYGVLPLTQADGKEIELYLSQDENNNDMLPVPLYMYKVVHDPTSRTATAFININSSFFNASVTESLTFCNDVSDSIKWLTWRSDGAHSFACDYEEFRKIINHIPRLDVDGLFK